MSEVFIPGVCPRCVRSIMMCKCGLQFMTENLAMVFPDGAQARPTRRRRQSKGKPSGKTKKRVISRRRRKS